MSGGTVQGQERHPVVETFETFDHAALTALQARDVPRVRACDYLSKPPVQSGSEIVEADEELARWDVYFAQFAKLTDAKCLCCGQSLRCYLGMGLFGGFAWGMANGEGHCTYCRYPMRGHHRVESLGTIHNLFLPYHPSTLSFASVEEP
jgi:hypothetical protein